MFALFLLLDVLTPELFPFAIVDYDGGETGQCASAPQDETRWSERDDRGHDR